MTYYLLVFVAGIAGSFHCIGMCGGFACALGAGPHGRGAGLVRHLLYNGGRVATYAFIGVIAGSLGGLTIAGHGQAPALGDSFDVGQRVLAVVAGLLMIVMALQLFGLLQRLHGVLVGFGGSTVVVALRSLLLARGPAAPLAFGVINGFLPCPLVYAFAAQAASTAAALPGFLTMAAFGLGTFPAMLLMGGVGTLLRPAWRRRGVWLAGGFILVLGLATIGRGLLPLTEHGLHLAHHGIQP
jgi:sulfite exporter TauE/SafE